MPNISTPSFMAFFKFRSASQKGVDEPASQRAPAESVEVMRRRARHRLIGAALLVLVGVVGFPLLFDTQPRPIPVDIPIEIPDKNKVKPLALPAEPAAKPRAAEPAPVAAAPAPVAPPKPASNVSASASLGAKEEVVGARTEAKPEPKPEHKAEARAEAKPEPKPEAKPAPKPDDGAKARALLEGKPAAAEAAADKGRFVVQVGAYTDTTRLRETRQKVEKAGYKTYTQEVETAEGKRTRVRVGPFGTRAEADKVASKIKGMDLPASILSL